MKKKLTAFILFVFVASAYTFAQTYEPFVIIDYKDGDKMERKELTLMDGEVSIVNNQLKVSYTNDIGNERLQTFNFDDIKKVKFENREITSVKGLQESKLMSAYMDNSSILRLKSELLLDIVNIYNAQGALVYQAVVNDYEAAINFSTMSKGMYIIRSSNEIVKFAK